MGGASSCHYLISLDGKINAADNNTTTTITTSVFFCKFSSFVSFVSSSFSLYRLPFSSFSFFLHFRHRVDSSFSPTEKTIPKHTAAHHIQ